MQIGSEILRMLMDAEIVYDYCDEYGEPGYDKKDENGTIIFGDIWCRAGQKYSHKPLCDYAEKNPDEKYRDGTVRLHSVEEHYPRLFAAMEEQGIEFQWHDEWIIDHNGGMGGKAYRTSGDSYHWESSILWTDGDFLTPDDDITDWIEECVDNPRMCFPSHVWSDAELMEQGFEEYECGYANGWYPGQTDDPVKISELIRGHMGADTQILFKLSGVGQFDIRFCVFVRNPDWEDEEE